MLRLISNLFFKQTADSHNEKVVDDLALNRQLISDSAFQGDLSVVTIENLMQLVSHAALSGELCLSSPVNSACFIVRDGALVFGHIDQDFPRLGERLVQAGHMTTDELQQCLLIYKEQEGNGTSRKRLGELLVEEEFVLDSHLEDIVKEQIKDCFFQVLSWNEGVFNFRVDDSPHHEVIHLDERIDHLILEGIIALDHAEDRAPYDQSLD